MRFAWPLRPMRVSKGAVRDGAAAGAGTRLSLFASRSCADARAAAAQALMAAKARYVMAQLQALGFEPWQTAAAVMRHGSDLEVRAPNYDLPAVAVPLLSSACACHASLSAVRQAVLPGSMCKQIRGSGSSSCSRAP